MCTFTARLHVTTHAFKRGEEDEGTGKKGGIILPLSLFFLKQLIIRLCLAAWLGARI